MNNTQKQKLSSLSMENDNFVNNGNAFWVVIILFTFLACMFGGCSGENIMSNQQMIRSIKQSSARNEFGICLYGVRYIDLRTGENIDLIFRDSCHKFTIGDIVTFKLK